MSDLTEADVRRIVRQEILVHVLNEHRLDYDLDANMTFSWEWPFLPVKEDADG